MLRKTEAGQKGKAKRVQPGLICGRGKKIFVSRLGASVTKGGKKSTSEARAAKAKGRARIRTKGRPKSA